MTHSQYIIGMSITTMAFGFICMAIYSIIKEKQKKNDKS